MASPHQHRHTKSTGSSNDQEQHPLLDDNDNNSQNVRHYESFTNRSTGGPPKRRSTMSVNHATTNGQHYLMQEVATRHTDLILMLCFGINGLIDSGAYNAYECFVCMITGNTIFAALGVSDLPVQAPRYQWTKSLSSIIAFLLGSLGFSYLHRFAGERKRWVLVASFVLQAAVIAISAWLVSRGTSSESPAKKRPHELMGLRLGVGAAEEQEEDGPQFPWIDLAPIALLSFQTAGKVVTSRILQLNALPTNVLSLLYSDLISDPALFAVSNVQRNRRAGGLLLYVGGAVVGGALAKSHVGFGGLLWIAAALSMAIALGWLGWWKEQYRENEGNES